MANEHQHFLVSDTGKLNEVLDCISNHDAFAIRVPTTLKHFDSLERMILRNLGEIDRTSTSQAIADTFRVGTHWALLALGFGSSDYSASLERDALGIIVSFSPRLAGPS